MQIFSFKCNHKAKKFKCSDLPTQKNKYKLAQVKELKGEDKEKILCKDFY